VEVLLIASVVVVLILSGLVVWLVLRLVRRPTALPQPSEGIVMLQQQVDSLQKLLNDRLIESSHALERFGGAVAKEIRGSSGAVAQMQESITRLDESSKKILEVGRDVTGLEKLLSSPKMRGGLGEFFLADMLAQILPPSRFSMQYPFKSGKKVDAVIFVGSRLVCIDSKFPLESFRRMADAQDDAARKQAFREFTKAIKVKIDEIADSYILPDEGTFNFALMYIPAESVYYETVAKSDCLGEDKSIASYALDRHVIPVSPNSLYLYLQTILMGLKGLYIEKRAKEVVNLLGGLRVEFDKFAEAFRVLGGHINHARARYEESERQLNLFSDKMQSISGLEVENNVGK